MKKLLHLAKLISVVLVITILTSSIGYAKDLSSTDFDAHCGKWNIEGRNIVNDQRMNVEQGTTAENDCYGLFALSNKTDVNIGDISLGGGYTLKLTTIPTNADAQFVLENEPFPSFLIPGVGIDVKAIPRDPLKQASVTLQGNISTTSFTFDLAVFLIKSLLAYSKIPCQIPSAQLIIIGIRLGPILGNTSDLAIDGDLLGSYKELSKVFPVFREKSYNLLKDSIVGCELSTVKPDNFGPPEVKILGAYMTWLPVVIFDYLQYNGVPASFTFVYTPTPISVFPSPEWIAFLNKNNIWLVHSNEKDLTQVTSNNNENPRVLDFKWSPNGKMLAYELGSPSGNVIFLYDLETSESTTLLSGVEEGFDWSLTGKQLIFRDKGVWIYNLEKGNKRKILSPTQNNIFGTAENPRFSADSNYVLLTDNTFDASEYYVANIETGQSAIILPADSRNGTCEWAPSDSIIACTREILKENLPGSIPEILIVDVNGKIQREIELPENMSQPLAFWSPTGKKLAIGYYDNKKSYTSLLDLESGDIYPLTSGIPLDWSPNRQWLLTWDAESMFSMPRHLSVVDINTGESKLLSEIDGLMANWQPYLQP